MPMPWPVRCDSAGKLVAGTIAPAFVGARARRHRRSRPARRSWPRGSRSAGPRWTWSQTLRCSARRVGAEDERARDVGLIAVHRAAAVEQDRARRASRSAACWSRADSAEASSISTSANSGLPPSAVVAASIAAPKSAGRHARAGALASVAHRASVMSLAACISASSAGDLIIRSARTTGLALTACTPGSCCCSRSTMK